MTCAPHHLASQGASPRGEALKKVVDCGARVGLARGVVCVDEGWAWHEAVDCGGRDDGNAEL